MSVTADGPYQARVTLALALLCIPAWLRGDNVIRAAQARAVARSWGGVGARNLAAAYLPAGVP
jgi:hypothetical protein